jgi:hypothetical protein
MVAHLVPALSLSMPKERAPAKGAPAMHIIPCKCKNLTGPKVMSLETLYMSYWW